MGTLHNSRKRGKGMMRGMKRFDVGAGAWESVSRFCQVYGEAEETRRIMHIKSSPSKISPSLGPTTSYIRSTIFRKFIESMIKPME